MTIHTSQREVAVTIDDLPLQPPIPRAELLLEITKKLIKELTLNNIPALGFVNEGRLYDELGEKDEDRIAVLKMWVEAGLELGNHTFSHYDLNDTPVATYLDDIARGEAISKTLLAGKGLQLKYFRHPYLHTGLTIETKEAVERFLDENGYMAAPVTFYNQDWIFAKVYDRAKIQGDENTMKRISDSYLPYMEEIFDFFEKLSVDLLGYEVKQVLLLHASALNADCLSSLAEMMKRRNYNFISMDRALTDKAYFLPDNFTGPRGRSSLHRWAGVREMDLPREPKEPEYISELYNMNIDAGQ